MDSRRGLSLDTLLRQSSQWPSGVPMSLCVVVMLALTANEASAAALGSLATSVGLFAALAALFVIKGWPAHLPASALSTAVAALLIAATAAWLWRMRAAERLLRFTGPGRSGDALPRRAAMCPVASTTIQLPPGFDRDVLMSDLRRHFVQIQDAWDRNDMLALRALTTPGMLDELCVELPACSAGRGSNCTDVVTLEAELLGFEVLTEAFVVSVEFSGLIRESAESGAVPFRELWMLTQSKHGASVWRLARHQALL